MAKAVCSTADLTPNDKVRYDKVRGKKGVSVNSARRAVVGTLLREANQEQTALIAEVQRIHPDLINKDGIFLEDLEAQRYEDEAQLEMDVEEGVQKQTAEDINAKQKEERKARSPKPSTKKFDYTD